MKRFLVFLLSLALILAAPVAEAEQKRAGKPSSAKVVKKAASKKKVGHYKSKRISAKSLKKRVSTRTHARQKLSRKASSRPDAFDSALAKGELRLRSEAALVIDQNTGAALYAKNPETATPIASITKLMTALVVLDAGLPLDEAITVGDEDVDRLKYTRSRLPLGSSLSRGELLHLALIASENRAAAALSRVYPGGREAFIRAMNRKAGALGMRSTYFVDGTGLSSLNRSTATDLAKLVSAAYQYPAVREITTTGSYNVEVPGQRSVRHIAYNNTNVLTRSKTWDIGISKTGYINEAGHCLVMQAKVGEQKVIIVLLDSLGKMSRIGDANRIRKWLEMGASRLASRQAPSSA